MCVTEEPSSIHNGQSDKMEMEMDVGWTTYPFESKGCWFKTVKRMRWIWIGCASGVVLINSHTSTAPSRGFSVTGWYQVRLPRVEMMGLESTSSNSWSTKCRWSALWKPKVGRGTTESLNATNASSSPTLSASRHATTWLKVHLHTISIVVIGPPFNRNAIPFLVYTQVRLLL